LQKTQQYVVRNQNMSKIHREPSGIVQNKES